MAKLDIKNRLLDDGNGNSLRLMKRVMVPRSDGSHSPGWIVDDYGYDEEFFKLFGEDYPVRVVLEEKCNEPNSVLHKRMEYNKLKDCEDEDT